MENEDKKELCIDAKVENLPAVNDFVAGMLAPLDCPMKLQLQLDLVVEEIFVNIASYAYGEVGGKVLLRGRIYDNPQGLELAFCDEGVPYDPLQKEDPDPDTPLMDRGVGGWGIFLVRKNVDDISYEYKDGKNILTIRKNIVLQENKK